MNDKEPKEYSSLSEFKREELYSDRKAGWSLDDFYAEVQFNPGSDDSLDDDESLEDFDF